MAQRSIQSPGVQISEVDISFRAAAADVTNVLVAGFASNGPTYEPITIGSISEYEDVFGGPTNGAERYLYHNVKSLLQSSATVSIARLPYGLNLGAGYGSTYSALVYPVSTYNSDTGVWGSILTNIGQNGGVYVFGAPSLIPITDAQYNDIIAGNAFEWAYDTEGSINFSLPSQFGQSGIVILNTTKKTTNASFEGYYAALIDNTTLNPSIDYRGVNKLLTVTTSGAYVPYTFDIVPQTRTNFALSAVFNGVEGSVSQVLDGINSFSLDTDEYSDVLTLGVFKLQVTNTAPDAIALNFQLAEGYAGSINYFRKIPSSIGGASKSMFIENVTQTAGTFKLLVNPYISGKLSSLPQLSASGTPIIKARMASDGTAYAANINPTFVGLGVEDINSCKNTLGNACALFPMGSYQDETFTSKIIGNVPGKLSKLLDRVENYEVYPLSLTVEAGLGTIYAAAQQNDGIFDDSIFLDIAGLSATDLNITGTAREILDDYLGVFNQYRVFADTNRKDHMFIADPLLPIFVQANRQKTLDNNDKNFTQHIYWPLRNQFGSVNTSYVTVYGNCVRVSDSMADKQVWVPFSGFAAALMANTDSNQKPWFAPAGFTRGTVAGANDIAIYPKQKQRDQLYKIGINPVAFFPAEGFAVYGQKTLMRQPSTFDRINVRRLFLTLETRTRNTVKAYVFEPNTLFTRTQVINALTPVFEDAKNTQGLYEYLLICDERNNTPTVIDNNELIVDIYIKPVRTAEFILVNFYATRTSQNFAEIVS